VRKEKAQVMTLGTRMVTKTAQVVTKVAQVVTKATQVVAKTTQLLVLSILYGPLLRQSSPEGKPHPLPLENHKNRQSPEVQL
jgi:hypothetical protein